MSWQPGRCARTEAHSPSRRTQRRRSSYHWTLQPRQGRRYHQVSFRQPLAAEKPPGSSLELSRRESPSRISAGSFIRAGELSRSRMRFQPHQLQQVSCVLS